MSDIAIRVKNLSKRHRIGQGRASYKTIRESLAHAVASPFRRRRDRRPRTEVSAACLRSRVLHPSQRSPLSPVPGQPSSDGYIWALKDVSCAVRQGQILGIPSPSRRATRGSRRRPLLGLSRG